MGLVLHFPGCGSRRVEDLLVVNGMERTGRDLDAIEHIRHLRAGGQPSAAQIFQARRMFPRQANGNLAFRNRGDLTFEETSQAWGFDFKGISSAMALADLDNDGALDVVVNPLNAPALIYRNTSPAPRIAVRLKGLPPNTHGIGARIGVTGGPVPLQTQEMICGGRYLSCDDSMRTFAAGNPTNRLVIEVSWRSGLRSLITNALPDHLYEIDEAAAQPAPASSPRLAFSISSLPRHNPGAATVRPWFEEISDHLGHVHHDDPFDDFSLQPLLPNKLSQLGPGLAWFDLDGDGYEDLLIGGGTGGRLGIFHNDHRGGFTSVTVAAFANPLARDQTTLLAWHAPNGGPVVLAGSANYEDGQTNGAAVLQYDLARKTIEPSVGADQSSTGPMALAALGGDGKLALFVGGRVIPGAWPVAASSRIFRHDGHQWQLDGPNSRVLNDVGLVSGAVFSDLDGDGYPDLILACEWGPLRIFRNHHGTLMPWDPPLTWPDSNSATNPASLSQLTGWWNSVTTGDFDGDGRLDLVAGNWGRNTKYQSLRSQPLSLYYGDLADDGSVQAVEAHYEPPLKKTVPLRQRDALARGIPVVRARFSSNGAYSTASIEEVLGEHLKDARILRTSCLESIALLNRGDHFEVRILPVEAQMAPVFGLCVGDFDGDGHEDVFLAQNFFDVQPETPRYDAGRGLLLKGDGLGNFQAVSGQESGIKIYGEQRGAALCDFDDDGRVDFAVAQNSAETRLFRNATGKPGLRVKLKGGPDNPDAFGAVMRLRCGERWGPAREIHGGSGYWSQDSTVQVLATPAPPRDIQVLWPGGRNTTNSIPAGAKEILLGADGSLNVLR